MSVPYRQGMQAVEGARSREAGARQPLAQVGGCRPRGWPSAATRSAGSGTRSTRRSAQIGLRRLAVEALLVAARRCSSPTLRAWQVLLAGLGSPLRTAGRRPDLASSGSSASTSRARSGRSSRRWNSAPRAKVPRGQVGQRLGPADDAVAAHRPARRRGDAAVRGALGRSTCGSSCLVPVLMACLHPRCSTRCCNWLFKLAKRPGLEQPLTRPGADARARLVVRRLDLQRPADLAARGQARRAGRAGRRCSPSAATRSPGASASWSSSPRPARASARCCSSPPWRR